MVFRCIGVMYIIIQVHVHYTVHVVTRNFCFLQPPPSAYSVTAEDLRKDREEGLARIRRYLLSDVSSTESKGIYCT